MAAQRTVRLVDVPAVGRLATRPVGAVAGPHRSARRYRDRVRIAFGTDETMTVSDAVLAALRAAGHDVTVVATDLPWPRVGRGVGEAVAGGDAERGVVCCWTGTGVSIAANKVPGVRAALCTDAETARGARRWNDANVLAVSLRLTSPAVAEELLAAFLDTPVDDDERAAIADLEPGAPTRFG